MTDNPPSYPCPKCGNAVLYTHGAIGRPVWCFCRACGTMFNPEHTNTPPLSPPEVDPAAAAKGLMYGPDPTDTPAPNPEPDAAPAERKRTMAPRPDPSTPFNDEELAKLPNWAQGKVRTLNRHLTEALEALNSQPQPEVQQNPDAPPTALDSVSAELLAQTRAELEELRYDYAARLARIAELVNDGLELAEVGEADGDEDE